jgi:hypothetical protein
MGILLLEEYESCRIIQTYGLQWDMNNFLQL